MLVRLAGNLPPIARVYALVLLLILLPFARGLYKRYSSPLRKYPGPFVASCSRLWRAWITYNGHSEHDHIDVHRKYGALLFSRLSQTCQATNTLHRVRTDEHLLPKKAPSSAQVRTSYLSRQQMPPGISSPLEGGCRRQVSTGCSLLQRIRTSLPRSENGNTLK